MSAPLLRLRAGVVSQAFNGETVLLDVNAGHYFGLNASGTVLLEQLLGGASRAEAIAAVEQRFQVDSARVAADLDALLVTLREAGLIEG